MGSINDNHYTTSAHNTPGGDRTLKKLEIFYHLFTKMSSSMNENQEFNQSHDAEREGKHFHKQTCSLVPATWMLMICCLGFASLAILYALGGGIDHVRRRSPVYEAPMLKPPRCTSGSVVLGNITDVGSCGFLLIEYTICGLPSPSTGWMYVAGGSTCIGNMWDGKCCYDSNSSNSNPRDSMVRTPASDGTAHGLFTDASGWRLPNSYMHMVSMIHLHTRCQALPLQ